MSFVTPMIALLAAAKSSASGSLTSILFLVLPLGLLLYLMVIPQRKQRQKQAQFLSTLEVGDDVVTAGGMYGTITFLEDGIAHLEVDTDVVIRVSVSSLSRAAETTKEPAETIDVTDERPAKGSANGGAAPKKKTK